MAFCTKCNLSINLLSKISFYNRQKLLFLRNGLGLVLNNYGNAFHTHQVLLKRRKTAEERKLPNMMEISKKSKGEIVDIWRGITVSELATVLNANVDYVFELFIDTIKGQNTPIYDLKVLHNAIRRSGRRMRIIAKPIENEDSLEEKDVFPRPPPVKSELKPRPPIVTVMGHVDHGKTTLLDALRHSHVVDQEFGGITQHIGAFSVTLNSGAKVTFLDTPGHAAFSSMRARGVTLTDIIVLVVAADDGVMEQTIECINMAQKAKVPILVAINKIDAPKADIKNTEQMLLQKGIQVESLGGDIQTVNISALKRINLEQLTEALVLQAEIMEIGADPTGLVEAVVVDSKIDPSRGRLCTVVVQRGILKKGNVLVAGSAMGKVRVLKDEQGNLLEEVKPGFPAEIEGWKDLPPAGELVLQVESEKQARSVIKIREQKKELEKRGVDEFAIRAKEEEHQKIYKEKLELRRKLGRFKLKNDGPRKPEIVEDNSLPVLRLVLKTDVDGTLEAILQTLSTYNYRECALDIVNYGVGPVTENDVELAQTFGGVIYAFNVACSTNIQEKANSEGVTVKHHNIIYKLVDSIKQDINELLPPREVDEIIGEAVVLQQFFINEGRKSIPIAGCRCESGVLKKGSLFKVMRNGQTVHEVSGDDTELKSYPIKRKVQNYDHAYKEEQDAEVDDQNLVVQPNRRIDDSPIRGLSNEKESGSRVIKSLDDQQSQDPYGLIYRKGKLLGILEPYPEIYELSPYSSIREDALRPAPAEEEASYLSNGVGSLADSSDDSEKDESSQNDLAKYADDKYPMILTSFKIDKKLNTLNSNKRERTSFREKLKQRHSIRDKYSADDSLLDTEEDFNDKSPNVDAIEDDLHDILDNIGLIDENLVKDKRDAEDENLEEGSNKIDIVKATHDPDQSEKRKREEESIEDDLDSKSTAPTVSKDEEKEMKLSDVQNYQSEGEDYMRYKRNEDINESIMKGLEKSGELTVSGNKSPLASSENESKTIEKRKNDELDQNNIEDYEKQLELSIRQKINAIKEEVKREIALLQAKAASQDKSSQRKNREISSASLLEKQSEMLSPQDDPEGVLLPLMRTKRNSEKNSRSTRNSGKNCNNENDQAEEDSYEGEVTSDSGSDLDVSAKAEDSINSELRENYTKREDHFPLKQARSQMKNLKMQRKRRHVNLLQNTPIISYMRRKRGGAVIPDGNVAYLPYRSEDYEIDEEGDEFDDDGFDDRSAGMHKRDIDDNEDYQSVVDYDYVTNNFQRLPSRKYVSNLNSDVYEHSLQDLIANNYLYDPNVQLRKKRHNFDEIVALHGGGPTVHHLSAVRNRNMRQLENKGPKYQRSSKIKDNTKEELENIVRLSDTDLFGGLPQSYEGELSRSKRVKRISESAFTPRVE
ncbi:hypothetical protein FQR65_LT03135 [Abscondita terminalis]|nr:hypothetical protein FQR65_LT03135 [Abscondita terminalis]